MIAQTTDASRRAISDLRISVRVASLERYGGGLLSSGQDR